MRREIEDSGKRENREKEEGERKKREREKRGGGIDREREE